MSGGKLTIDDIAKALGVSKTTVSRAISGKGRISQATTARVLAYIEQHKYRPSAMARGLAKQKTFNICVVWPGEEEVRDMTLLPFFQRCLLGAGQTAAGAGYDLVVSLVSGDDISNLQRIVEHHKADGVILTRILEGDRAAAYLKETGLPFVAVGSSPDPDLIQIDNDHYGACRAMTAKVLSGGAGRPILLASRDRNRVTGARRRGFEDGCRDRGIALDEESIIPYGGQEDWNSLQDTILQKGADILFCMDDAIAMDIMARCRQEKIRIPEAFQVASFYDSHNLSLVTPGVTALSFDDRRLGREAARILLEKIGGEAPSSLLLKEYQIIERESTRRL